MSYQAERVRHMGTSIFAEMTHLANEYQAINLGQGFPDFPTPDFLKAAAQEAIAQEINQYAPSMGRPRLRQAVAQKMGRDYGHQVNPDTEVLITHGATEAIFASTLGLVNPGDEVIIGEPFYDSYLPAVQMAGGVPRFYQLQSPDWTIDFDHLAGLFNRKTKLLLINTPHNPTGKVFTAEEMGRIAALCIEHDVLALVDEVYEHIIFDDYRHVTMAQLPGMRPRTLHISSLGKTFSATGWKVGWLVAPPELIQATFRAHQFMTFCGAAPLQEAAAVALETATTYYKELRAMYQAKRDLLLDGLKGAGLRPLVPQGTYFVMVDISGLGFADDVAFCRYLTTEIGVAAIPPSAFYYNPKDGAGLARFAFCKRDEVLVAAAVRLQKLQVTNYQ